jgi:hypothetical protein
MRVVQTYMNAPEPIGLHAAARREAGAKRRHFYDRYDLLLANWYLLTDRIQHEIEEVREDLHEELAGWRPDQPEPDWTAYADRVNTICREEGLQLPVRSG